MNPYFQIFVLRWFLSESDLFQYALLVCGNKILIEYLLEKERKPIAWRIIHFANKKEISIKLIRLDEEEYAKWWNFNLLWVLNFSYTEKNKNCLHVSLTGKVILETDRLHYVRFQARKWNRWTDFEFWSVLFIDFRLMPYEKWEFIFSHPTLKRQNRFDFLTFSQLYVIWLSFEITSERINAVT